MPTITNRVTASLKLTSYSLALLLAVGSVLLGCRENPIVDEDGVCSLPPAGVGAPVEPDSAFVWRLCNTSDWYPMDNLELFLRPGWTPLAVEEETLHPCTCSPYITSAVPLQFVRFVQHREEHLFLYLASKRASRGLQDTLAVIEAPGRYTYHFLYEVDEDVPPWTWPSVEIEREAYYNQDEE